MTAISDYKKVYEFLLQGGTITSSIAKEQMGIKNLKGIIKSIRKIEGSQYIVKAVKLPDTTWGYKWMEDTA